MLAEHLHDAPVASEMHVIGLDSLHPDAVRNVEHRIEPVGRGLVRTHDAKILRLGVEAHHLAEITAHDARRLADSSAGSSDFESQAFPVRQYEVAFEKP